MKSDLQINIGTDFCTIYFIGKALVIDLMDNMYRRDDYSQQNPFHCTYGPLTSAGYLFIVILLLLFFFLYIRFLSIGCTFIAL